MSSQSCFTAARTLSYHVHKCTSTVSVSCLAPVNFRRGVTRLVSYYALFE
ncbi:hypothetical protein ME784_19490 [Lactobacillus delbrueckii]|nr:hypothetical protein NRIC0766_18700 [Lactobacillus delbrueckii subsp. sunkii]GHN21434.1 hypothetical protein ME784_19490 [Lactobacillus delbrueckii]GHN30926.1 hypothetical protein ME789_19110 [Lactobacillus delbrueckii]GHN57769.1 hypothetical protein ME804_18090 [Lactobacillus delbrueckii]